VLFGKVTYGMGLVTFLLLVLPACNYHNRKDKVHSPQGKKQNEAGLSGSNFINLYVKKALIGEKVAHC
jgi:hypothetical protein